MLRVTYCSIEYHLRNTDADRDARLTKLVFGVTSNLQLLLE